LIWSFLFFKKRTRSPPLASLLTSSQILESSFDVEAFALGVTVEDVFVGANGVTDVVVVDEAEVSDLSSRTCCM